jgi:hypothetical protein
MSRVNYKAAQLFAAIQVPISAETSLTKQPEDTLCGD